MIENNDKKETLDDSFAGSSAMLPAQRDRIKWLRERFIPILSLIVAGVSLTMAYFTVTRSLETGRQLKTISEETGRQLKAISDNQSTRYLGDFPGCLGEITKVLEEANAGEEITIISDFPGYGIYSDHQAFLSYARVIETKAIKNTPVSMVVLNHDQRVEVLKAQFGRRKINEIRETVPFKEFLIWSDYKDVANMRDSNEFCSAVAEEQKKVRDKHFSFITNANWYESRQPLPILLWIVGNRVAVFSIPNLKTGTNEDAVEAAFITRDQGLIGQLKVIAQAYFPTTR